MKKRLMCMACEKAPATAGTHEGLFCAPCYAEYVKTHVMVCDFCSEKPVLWSYECVDLEIFTIEDTGGVSRGGWAACQICHDLIETDAWDDLLDRSVGLIPEELRSPVTRMIIRTAHKAFRQHKQPAQRIAPEPPRAA